MWTARLEDTIPHWTFVLLQDDVEVARIPLDDWLELVRFTDFDAVSLRVRQPPHHPLQGAEPQAGPRPG
jgi:hypothetical protein